ncbi:MAG: sugar ABC transporter substrate-binding protein [Planctomycetaceae bacterium]|nr:sugar ABC transporter substrate-binding protein [Planctomycetaceae bacterium]
MKKFLAPVLAFCLLAGMASAGQSIRFVASVSPVADAIRALLPDFEKETGITVEMEQLGNEQLSQKLTVEFASGGSGIDVFMIRPLDEARMLKRNGWAVDLSKWLKDDADYDFADYSEGSIQCTSVDGFQTSIPLINECQVIYYRKDVFEKAGVQPPKTFEELEKVAAAVTDKSNERYGFVSRGARNALITQFSSYLYGFGGDFSKDGQALMDTPEAHAAIDYYGRMLRLYGPEGVHNMSWPQAAAIFQQGKGAMYIDASSQYPSMLDPTKSSVADVTGVAMFPAGPTAHAVYDITAWAIGIYSNSQNQDAAWQFVRYMTDKDRTLILQGEYANQCARMSIYNSPEGIKKLPADWVKAVSETGPIGVGHDRPQLTAVAQARDILSEPVTLSIDGKDFKGAAARANQRFQELLDREK